MEGFRLKGIKSFIDSENIEIKPITIFVGENSSGKSSLLRFNSVLAQTFREEVFTPLLLFGKMIDYGNYEEVINSKKNNNDIYFEINFGELEKYEMKKLFRYKNSISDGYQKYLEKSFRIGVTLYCEKKIKLKKFIMYANDKPILEVENSKGDKYNIFSKMIKESREESIINAEVVMQLYKFLPWGLEEVEDVEIIKLQKKYFDFLNEDHKDEEEFKRFIYEISYREIALKDKYLEMYNEYLEIENHIEALNLILEIFRQKLMDYSENLSYIGPFRSKPERNYREYESTYDTVGVNGENTYQILKQNFDNKDIFVSRWLKQILGVSLNIKEIEGSNLYKIMIQDNSGTETNLIDTGYGISQILPILTEVLYEEKNRNKIRRIRATIRRIVNRKNKKTLIIEQPELHLHPAAQSKLAELFLDFIEKGHNLILETHSEHLIKKFQILVAEDNNFNHNDIAIYYVHKDRGEGAKVERLLLDENGRFFKEWPTGFFDEGYKLATELLRTITNKKMQLEKKGDRNDEVTSRNEIISVKERD